MYSNFHVAFRNIRNPDILAAFTFFSINSINYVSSRSVSTDYPFFSLRVVVGVSSLACWMNFDWMLDSGNFNLLETGYFCMAATFL